ncbi:MAG: heme ABC exporter ATP-binding protein CcmA [Rickettsiaceae bacterium H1]|nr:heme ABC exporter ATP-binding protein CcmA [Rickettsiaceae bacterium H1]
MEINLSAENISYSRDDKKIIDNLSFNIKSGEILFIAGKNGVGKTTLLRIISGIIKPQYGLIKLDDEDIWDDPDRYKKIMSYLGHKSAFNEDLTVEQNLTFWAGLRDTYELLYPAVYYFNLQEVINIKYLKLSAGWKKRVALARVMASDAKIWLLDEPFANLDREIKELFYGLLNSRVQQNGMLIITGHEEIELEGKIQKLNLNFNEL